MTDPIIFGKGIGPIGGPAKPRRAEDAKAEPGKAPADRVNFSSVLQEVNKAKAASAAPDTERAQRIAALKAQVADGSYRPDLNKVAESLVKFIAEES